MKFQFLGTAAAEGVPGIFCVCQNCVRSRRIGGRALRTRSQAIIDDQLLIDFPADIYFHVLTHNIQMENVSHCLITHTHSDHLYPNEIRMLEPGFATMPEDYRLTFYGSKEVAAHIRPKLAFRLDQTGTCQCQTIEAFECFQAGAYQVTALPAVHRSAAEPMFYQISDGKKTILYAHDTGYFAESVWEFWAKEKPYFNLVSLDCTNVCLELNYDSHMGLVENIQVRERMIAEGYADESTVFVCNHFSHNGTAVVYDDFVPIALSKGFLTSYDGMVIEV